ncbi:uncharacterized protein LOC123693904 [Colias croceus]|uniref:uncharacterized protein LOC123693904 n=1 Tax=Colias crocea TaxID=72248 RepID=UPI001E27E0C6|nr:uncharacterized protein LOC123693904 [Colias croceus]
MRRVLILFMVFLSVTASSRDTYEKCAPMLEDHTSVMCCKDYDLSIRQENNAECYKIPSTPNDCEREKCVINKRGLLKPNGEIDISKIESDFESLGGEPEKFLIFKDKCLFNNDLDAYAMEDACPMKKMFNCLRAQVLFNCKIWVESDACNEFKEKVEDCTELY